MSFHYVSGNKISNLSGRYRYLVGFFGFVLIYLIYLKHDVPRYLRADMIFTKTSEIKIFNGWGIMQLSLRQFGIIFPKEHKRVLSLKTIFDKKYFYTDSLSISLLHLMYNNE